MRYLVLLSALPLMAWAQPPLDIYQGVVNTTCTNPNGSTYFGIATVGSRKVWCDPLGHQYFFHGNAVIDLSSSGQDETGHNYGDYLLAKYGNPPNYLWAGATVGRMNSWDSNGIGPESTTYMQPWHPWVPSGTNPNKLPIMLFYEVCSYSWINNVGFGTAPVKDVLGARSPFWTGFVSSGVTDYFDPAWANYVNGSVLADTQTTGASSADKAYLLGVSFCDSDTTHGFEAGPAFDTEPDPGFNDWRLSYLVALASPIEFASTRQNQIYVDPTMYVKKALYTQLTGEFGSVAALNTAWSSSYTTFGTSGTCIGSNLPSWLCPSPGAATSIGTGNGSTTVFSHTLSTTVSANSLGIYSGATLVGGDNGSGTIFGPGLAGTINYSTGALSITFTVAPSNAVAITADYIANGWGIGTGAMDEDGRTAHQTYTGHNPICIDGVGVTAACISGGGGSPYASAGMVTDMNTLDTSIAAKYASVTRATVQTYFPGLANLGPYVFFTFGTPSNAAIMAGMATNVDAFTIGAGGAGAMTQAELDYVHSNAGNVSLTEVMGATANQDSSMTWPNSTCTRSGTTVTCTVATPQAFFTGRQILTSCVDTTYNVSGTGPSSVGANTVVYTAPVTPTGASTTCNVTFDDAGGGKYATQLARGTAIATNMATMFGQSYTATGFHPYIALMLSNWVDKWNEQFNWGIVDTRDNAYDGHDTTTATVACSSPNAAFSCGGELRSGWGSDSATAFITNANIAIDNALLGSVSSITGKATMSGGTSIH